MVLNIKNGGFNGKLPEKFFYQSTSTRNDGVANASTQGNSQIRTSDDTNVTLSAEAIQMLEQSETAKAAYEFIGQYGRQLYENSFKPYRDNLATIATDPTTPTEERTEAQNALTERESLMPLQNMPGSLRQI